MPLLGGCWTAPLVLGGRWDTPLLLGGRWDAPLLLGGRWYEPLLLGGRCDAPLLLGGRWYEPCELGGWLPGAPAGWPVPKTLPECTAGAAGCGAGAALADEDDDLESDAMPYGATISMATRRAQGNIRSIWSRRTGEMAAYLICLPPEISHCFNS